MHKKHHFTTILLSVILLTYSCKKDEADKKPDEQIPQKTYVNLPEFYSRSTQETSGNVSPDFYLIANNTSRIENPQDLDFNPNPFRPNELWIVNKGNPNTGGSTVMLTEVGTPSQKFDWRRDGNAWHFMSMPSAISFSNNFNWATSHNILDANHSGGSFAGPTLWSSDLNVYARNAGPGTNGSHLDMLHGSPLSMGIESFVDNKFFVFDGYNSQIVFYDFKDDHGPGMHDHSDGIIHRYVDFSLLRDAEVPSHLVMDKFRKWLYIVDGGNKRILRLDVTSGETRRLLPEINEPLGEHLEKHNTTWNVLVDKAFGLKRPSGIELIDNRLFVSDYETGEIICFDIETQTELGRINTGNKGIMGIKVGPDKKLYYVNALTNSVHRVDPKN
jgi:hypothetical protein